MMKYKTILHLNYISASKLQQIVDRLPKTKANYVYMLLLEEQIRGIKYTIAEKLKYKPGEH